jgi:hypothetical protein
MRMFTLSYRATSYSSNQLLMLYILLFHCVLQRLGNVRNRKSGPVAGVIQGPEESVEAMKQWLSTKG